MLQIFSPGHSKMRAVAGNLRQGGRLTRRTGMLMRRGNRDLDLPPAPEKGRSLRVLSAADEPATRDGGFSRSLDERRLGFSTRRPGQSRKRLRVQAAVCLTLNEDSPPERLAHRATKAGLRSIGSARLCS